MYSVEGAFVFLRDNIMKINLPCGVQTIISKLAQKGYNSYAVGGCIRDSIMNKTPSDWDICTSSMPEETLSALGKNNIIKNGLKHGTVTVRFDGISYEITTFRVDGEYTDNRHPNNVKFVRNLKDDLARRDFTINAMAYNDSDGLCDYYGGLDDIKNKIIRCVGDPDKRFYEDGLRIMRALRFAAVLGFDIEKDTAESIHRCCGLLKNISAERIMSEFSKLIVGQNAEKILLEYSDVFCVFIPEIRQMIGFKQKNPHHIYDVWTHTVKAVVNTPPEKIIRLSALFHDIGKPKTFFVDKKGIGHFYGHPKVSADLTHKILRRLKCDNKTLEQVTTLVKMHDVMIIPEPKYVRRVLAKIGTEMFRKLLYIKRADSLAQNPSTLPEKTEYLRKLESVYNDEINKTEDFSLKSLAINGNDLIEIGITDGKQIGDCLKKLFSMIIDGTLKNEKTVLLETAKKICKIK